MRKFLLGAIVLVVIGVAVALWLIPSKDQITVLQKHDEVQVNAGTVDVEAEYKAGRRTWPIVAGLADKRVAEGNRPAAIQLLEEYVTANPTDINGRKKLAEQYQLAGDGVKYNEQLEAIAAAAPTEENLKILSDVYNSGQLYDKQIEVLKKLVEVTKEEKPQYMADLATILVVQGRKDEALAEVHEIRAKHPDFRSYAITRIEASALVADGKGDDAYNLAEQWMQGSLNVATTPSGTAIPTQADNTVNNGNAVSTSTKELADLANILNYGGFPDLAIKLIDPRQGLVASDPELALAYVNANINAGHSDRAFAILTDIYNSGKMDAVLYAPYFDLALARDDVATATTVAANLNPQIFSEEQAINLIELQSVQNHPDVLAKMVASFDKPDYLVKKDVLTAVIAMNKNAADQDAKIAIAIKADLSSTMRVKLAEACYHAKKDTCVDEVVKGFPALETMTRQQLDEYADLHIVIDRAPRVVDAYGQIVAGGRKEVEPAYIRLAAASGKTDVVDQWLVTNGNTADIKLLQQLYYIAADHNQPATASQFASKLFERDPSPMNREILVSSYIRSGQYAKALPLVRDNLGKTANASDQYITVLSKLSKKDKDARDELNKYAMSQLTTSEDNKTQLTAAYTLINNGARTQAMPYIKTNAENKGGEWAVMWRQLNPVKPKAGVAYAAKKLTREQMVAIASDPKTSEATKRQMAFNLIANGNKADAAAIFQGLAANRGPDDQNVKDLLYLWGPKLNADQVAWLTSRAKNSHNAYEQAKWSSYINNYGDDNAIVQYVSGAPDALYDHDLRQKYFKSLASYGSVEVYDTNMRNWVAGTTDVGALRDYAATAQAYGYNKAAANAYQRIVQIAPGDEKALAALGAMSYSKANYTASQQYLTRYEQSRVGKPQPETDPQEAYFYQAMLYRRQGNTQAAQAEFQKVVQASGSGQGLATDAASRLYTSLYHLGQRDQAKQGFRALLAANPDNKSVLADYMSVLIEYKDLDEATAIANQYDKASPYYQRQGLNIDSQNISGIERMSNGREMKISFNQPIEGKAPIDSETHPWVEKTAAGYDSMVVTAKPGYQVQFQPTAENSMQVVPIAYTPASTSPQEQMQREQDLRLQLLYAQIEQQNGQSDAASKRLAILQQYYPNNPELMTYAANIQTQAGNTTEAMKLLRQAQTLSPENEDIARVLTNVQEVNRTSVRNYIRGDFDYRGTGSNNEYFTGLSGAARVADHAEVGFKVRNDSLDLHGVRRGSDGKIGDWSDDKQQGELFAAYLGENGSRAQASIFMNNDTAGGGLYYDFNNAIGRSGVFGEYHRPYWDFAEAALEDTTRDRVGVRHYAALTPSLSFGGEASANRYNTSVDDDVAESALIRLSLIQRIQEQTPNQPYLGIGYGFDGEYMFDEPKRRTTVNGNYKLLPIVSREVHFLSGIYQDDWTPSTHARLVAGWAFDRLGENGPQVEGQLNQDITDRLEAGVYARYGLQTSTSNDDDSQLNAGAHLMYKF